MSEALAIREKHDGALADRSSVRLWLRLLSCTMAIEKVVQRRLAERGATLPRFDVLAALERHPDGMTMGALSRSLLVSNGNVTAIVQKLARDGHVGIAPLPSDRRASLVRLTREGRAYFAQLSEAHHDWIDELLAALQPDERDALYGGLGRLKVSIGQAAQEEDAREP